MAETSSAPWKKFWRRFIAEAFKCECNFSNGPQKFLTAMGRDRSAKKCEARREMQTDATGAKPGTDPQCQFRSASKPPFPMLALVGAGSWPP